MCAGSSTKGGVLFSWVKTNTLLLKLGVDGCVAAAGTLGGVAVRASSRHNSTATN